MINRKPVHKSQLIALVNDYDNSKGYRRKLFGDTDGIKALRKFINQSLAVKAESEQLNINEVDELISILRKRFIRIKNTQRDYRNSPTRPTNKTYRQLACLISDDPKVLGLTQIYKNDNNANGLLLIDSNDEILVTTAGYAFSVCEIEKHIQVTQSLSYAVHADGSLTTVALSKDDISALEKHPTISSIINVIRNKFLQYANHESLSGEPLLIYPENRLFVTGDKYCFVMTEYIKILMEQCKFYNPYTNKDLSETEIEELLKLPEINHANKVLYAQQYYCATRISLLTIGKLAVLAEGLLNNNDILSEWKWTPVPDAQKAYEDFDVYYKEMPENERECLNNYWIGSWSYAYALIGIVPGMGTMKFGNLYHSINSSCVHSIAGSIIKLIKQLDPDTVFKFDNVFATMISSSIGRSNFFEAKKYFAVSNKCLVEKKEEKFAMS